MLANPNTIDIVLKKDKTGRIGLVITAHEPWDDATLEQLRKKLAAYVSYVRGSNYRSQYGSDPAFIRLVSLHEATAEVQSLLTATTQASSIATEIEHFAPPGSGPGR